MQIEYKFLETEINSTTCKYGTEEGLNHILYKILVQFLIKVSTNKLLCTNFHRNLGA